MQINEIIQLANKYGTNNCYLTSVFMLVEKDKIQVHFIFYDELSRVLSDFILEGGKLEKIDQMPTDKQIPKLELSNEIEYNQAIEIVNEKFDNPNEISTYLLSLHTHDNRIVWTVNVICRGLMIKTYEIDSHTKEILSENISSLIK